MSSSTSSSASVLEKLLQDNPRFHFYQGKPTSWAPHPETLRYLFSLLAPRMATLETGCGQSTVVFAIAGTRHVSVMPNSEEAGRVQRYCAELELAGSLSFVLESSDLALPRRDGTIPDALDFVFIDGAHGFPAPFIDWHYTARRLKIGGVLGVDDYKMPSVHLLFRFLRDEDEWELIRISQNTAFFRKLAEPKELVDWSGQKINAGFRGH